MSGGAVWIAESKNYAIVWRYHEPGDERYYDQHLEVVKKVPYKDTGTNTLEFLGFIPCGSGYDALSPKIQAAFKELEEEAKQRKKYEEFSKEQLSTLDMWDAMQDLVKKNRAYRTKLEKYEPIIRRLKELADDAEMREMLEEL